MTKVVSAKALVVLVFASLFSLFWSPISHAQQTAYHIDLTDNEHQLAQVKIDFPATSADYIDVKMPVWRTGLYYILDLPRTVRHFQAKDADGNVLAANKIDKSTWRIAVTPGVETAVSYQVYANELGRRSRHIDDSHAYLDASAIFMYADAWREQPVTVSLDVPAEWRSTSGMEKLAAHKFTAPNWDVLVDSPIETGIHSSEIFTVDGREYEVLFWGHGNYDVEQTVADIKKLVTQGSSIWSSYPYERYVFMMHATDGAGGATEHLNSTVIQRPRYSFASRKDYLSFMSTVSHEFVHTWNVKAYRPEGLVPYAYQQENYTDLLWIAEGSTSYFQDHLLVRAEVMKLEEYLTNLARSVESHQRKPGTDTMSVAEASFNQWIAESGSRAHNASVNIYAEGALVSLALDIELLQRTDNKVSYRDVHEALYQNFKATEIGFNSNDVKAILAELTGQNWDAWWQEHVEQPKKVDTEALLNSVGLMFAPRDAKETWVGWRGKQTDNGVQLTLVERHSPAWEAGFTEGDIVSAINDKRVTHARLQSHLDELTDADVTEVAVQFFRRDLLTEKNMVLATREKGDLVIQPMTEPTAEQAARFQAWLGIEHPHASQP